MEENKRIQWHPGFYAGLEFELRDYRDVLDFKREYLLSKESTRMDMLVIKKRSDIDIKTVFGRIFKKHNVIEYKSPVDELSIDDLYKTIGYACMYKGYGNVVDEIESTDMTISLFRHSYPAKLMKRLETLGAKVESPYPGVYYVSGIINIPLQIVVVGILDKDECNALRILTTDAKESDVKRFISIFQNATIQADKHNIDAILQVSVQGLISLQELIDWLNQDKLRSTAN